MCIMLHHAGIVTTNVQFIGAPTSTLKNPLDDYISGIPGRSFQNPGTFLVTNHNLAVSSRMYAGSFLATITDNFLQITLGFLRLATERFDVRREKKKKSIIFWLGRRNLAGGAWCEKVNSRKSSFHPLKSFFCLCDPTEISLRYTMLHEKNFPQATRGKNNRPMFSAIRLKSA